MGCSSPTRFLKVLKAFKRLKNFTRILRQFICLGQVLFMRLERRRLQKYYTKEGNFGTAEDSTYLYNVLTLICIYWRAISLFFIVRHIVSVVMCSHFVSNTIKRMTYKSDPIRPRQSVCAVAVSWIYARSTESTISNTEHGNTLCSDSLF